MSQYCSGLIAIVLHEQQPWSVIWSFHECFTVFVAIQDTYIGKTQAHTQNNHPPKNNTTIKGKQKKKKGSNWCWDRRVRDRSRKQENMKTPWTTYKTTHKKSEKTETQQTNTRTQNLFFCRLFVVCSLWLFLIFDIFWLRPCFGVCMGFMNHNTYIYIYVYHILASMEMENIL